jgi:hypothetical protein
MVDTTPLLYFVHNEHNDDLITLIAFSVSRLKSLSPTLIRSLDGMNTCSFESFVSTCLS